MESHAIERDPEAGDAPGGGGDPDPAPLRDKQPPAPPSSFPDAVPFALSPWEWLTLFPMAPVPDHDSGSPPPPDPALSLRAADPLTPAAMLAGLGAASPVLRGWTRAQLAVSPWAAGRTRLRFATNIGLGLALLSVQWTFNGEAGRFGVPQLAAATVCTATAGIASLMLGFYTGRRRYAGPKDLSTHPLAVVVRWVQLQQLSGKDGSPLLAHDPGDKLCPCSQCGMRVVTRAAWLRTAEFAVRILVIGTGFMFYFFWMPAVVYRSYTWSTSWAAVLCVLFAISSFEFHVNNLLVVQPLTVGPLDLSLRLHNRAVSLALVDFRRRYRILLAGADGPSVTRMVPEEETYIVLQSSMVPTWIRRLSIVAFGPFYFFVVATPNLVVSLVASLAAGNCIPAAVLFGLGYHLCIAGTDLLNFAESNAHVSVVRDLYTRTRTALLELGIKSDTMEVRGGTGRRSPAAVALLERHDALLGSYIAASGNYLARYMGFAVDGAVVRNVVATFVTVAVGLLGILRGSGVYVTWNMACG
ncbi:hypothetical protein DFJ74DRAFT_652322 [Hyaloraphidium curvatum]|nr:hypothetical protein DFJ74DRAFT_652322 [Hyaloraphidium curvatum]